MSFAESFTNVNVSVNLSRSVWYGIGSDIFVPAREDLKENKKNSQKKTLEKTLKKTLKKTKKTLHSTRMFLPRDAQAPSSSRDPMECVFVVSDGGCCLCILAIVAASV